MSDKELVAAFIILGFLGLQHIPIAQAQESPKDQMNKNQTINNTKNQNLDNYAYLTPII